MPTCKITQWSDLGTSQSKTIYLRITIIGNYKDETKPAQTKYAFKHEKHTVQ